MDQITWLLQSPFTPLTDITHQAEINIFSVLKGNVIIPDSSKIYLTNKTHCWVAMIIIGSEPLGKEGLGHPSMENSPKFINHFNETFPKMI